MEQNRMTNKIKRYSEGFKRQVVSEYEAGTSIVTLQKKYGISGNTTIQRWISQFGREGMRHELLHIQTAEEVERVKALEQQVEELQQALGRVTLEKLKLESQLAALQGGEELAKKNDRASSSASTKKPAPRSSR
jgi:transposase-like protein